MVLHAHSDASYLSAPQARSRAGGYLFLSSDPSHANDPPINGPIHVLTNIMKNVMASATEAETGAAFVNAQECCAIRQTLDFLGHIQPATPITIDNTNAAGILNDTIKQRRSKAIDMRFYWLRDRVDQGQYTIHWKPGATNLADYFTKHHSPAHHKRMRPIYIHEP